jgi:hypothetical protein
MHAALRFARYLTAALSILLMLGAVVASAQAKAAHTDVVLSALAMPCHHALASDETVKTSALDLCRDLCLTQAPDTLMAPTGLSAAPSVVTELLPANTYAYVAATLSRPALDMPRAHAPPLRPSHPASTKLLI